MHRRTILTGVLALVAVTAGATALAAAPQSGTYKGTLAAPRTAYRVTLTTRGSALRKATLSNIPIYCSGGGPAIPVRFGATKISATGTFTDHATRRIPVGPLKGKVGQKLTLSGRFTSHGTVTGRLHTTFPLAPKCGGTSTFSAKR